MMRLGCDDCNFAAMGKTVRKRLDRVDRRVAKFLSEDGRDRGNTLADRLKLSPPTVRARIRAMIERNVLRIVGVLDVAKRPELIAAIVGIHANGRGKLNAIAKKMSELPFVTSVSIVTGRYDIIAEVLFEGDMEMLYQVTSELLPGLAEPGVISGSETFVVMQSHNKWMSLPNGCWEEDVGSEEKTACVGRN